MFCVYCGKEVVNYAKYCNHCGKFIGNTSIDNSNYTPEQEVYVDEYGPVELYDDDYGVNLEVDIDEEERNMTFAYGSFPWQDDGTNISTDNYIIMRNPIGSNTRKFFTGSNTKGMGGIFLKGFKK